MTPRIAFGPLDFRALSPALKRLILANLIVFVGCWLAGRKFYDLFGLVPAHVWGEKWIWQPFTYLFLHGNLLHLFLNLLSLWMFARPVEMEWGSREFVKYYFICGIGAGLFSAAVQPGSHTPIIGASGAVFGVLVAFAMLNPDAVVYYDFILPLKARDMAILYGIIEFFAGATSSTPGIARFTHLGGMLIGYLYIRWWGALMLRTRILLSRMNLRMPSGSSGERHGAGHGPRVPDARGSTGRVTADEVDRILDKISAQGKESLTEEELDLLRQVSEKKWIQ